jgi:hypothetical protein
MCHSGCSSAAVFCRSRFRQFICSLLLSAGRDSINSSANLADREPFWLFICRFFPAGRGPIWSFACSLAHSFILQARHCCFIASADLSAGQMPICFIRTHSSILQAQHFCFIARPSPGISQAPRRHFTSIWHF